MKTRIAPIALLLTALSLTASAQNVLDLEAAYVIPGYNDVAIPGDTGTRLSLTEELDADDTVAFRLRYGHMFSEKHFVGFLAAPLEIESRGTLAKDVNFNNVAFPAGTPLKSTFRFDSYRLIYRYLFHKSDRLQFSFGAAGKIRDAAIKLEGGGQSSEKTDTGLVPLLSFNLTWTPADRLHLLVDGEALAAPQGRAEDVLFAVQYDATERLALKAGYRILEGGADNDEVYTFSLFHYFVAGAVLTF